MDHLKGKHVVLISLIPDAGHLKSLLLILKKLKAVGANVYALVPDEAETLVSSFGFPYYLIGEVVPDEGRRYLKTLSRSGKWKHVFITRLEVQKRYFLELIYNGLHRRLSIDEKLGLIQCDALLCDPHLFFDEYSAIAENLDVPLFAHEVTGTLYDLLNRHDYLKSNSRVEGFLERFALTYMPAWHYRFNKIFRRKRFQEWRRMSRFIEKTRNSYRTTTPRNVYRIKTGTAKIENKYIFNHAYDFDESRRFGPLDPGADWGGGQEVSEWLTGCDDNSVVYLTFGTMASPPEKLIIRIISRLLTLNKKVLIATKSRLTRLVYQSDEGDFLRVDWAPQTAVLASSKIAAFVSHMGSNSFREALWFGKPVLGIPLLWDQFYCSWAAEQLGIGRTILDFGLSDDALFEVISDVLLNDWFFENVKKLSDELKSEEGGSNVALYVDEVLTRFAESGRDIASK